MNRCNFTCISFPLNLFNGNETNTHFCFTPQSNFFQPKRKRYVTQISLYQCQLPMSLCMESTTQIGSTHCQRQETIMKSTFAINFRVQWVRSFYASAKVAHQKRITSYLKCSDILLTKATGTTVADEPSERLMFAA